MFKKKCPVCGARNSKERMVCIECGAPLASEQVKKQLSYVSTEAEAPVKTVIEKEPKESVEDEYRDNEKVLYKARGPRVHKKSAWFRGGVVLLSISALWWLVLILASLEDIGGAVLAAVLTTSIPIGVGVYCVRRGRKVAGVETRQNPESAYVSQPAATPTQETQPATEPTYSARSATKPAQRTRLAFFGKRDEAENRFKEAKRCSDPRKNEFDLDGATSLLEEAVLLKPDNKKYGQKLDEIREIKAKSCLKFSMQVREVMSVTLETGATSMLITGRVAQGTVHNGNEVEIKGRVPTRRAKVILDDPEGFADRFAVPGKEVSLILEGLTGEDIDITEGDIVEGV